MKRVLAVSVLLNVILAGWILVLRAPQRPPSPPATKPSVAAQRIPRTFERIKPAAASPKPVSTNASPFDWRQVESEDYHQYIANLRTIGCPEKTIRDIIVADVNDVFESRRAAILRTNYQYWHSPQPTNREPTKQIWALYIQKKEVLKSLGFGGADFTDLVWQFYREGMDRKELELDFLPESQRQRVREYMFEEESKEVLGHTFGGGSFPTQNEIMESVRQLLTPEEFKEYEFRTSADADMVRRALDGADVTESEYRTIFEWTRSLEALLKDMAGNSEEYIKAWRATNSAVKALLGPERYERTQFEH